MPLTVATRMDQTSEEGRNPCSSIQADDTSRMPIQGFRCILDANAARGSRSVSRLVRMLSSALVVAISVTLGQAIAAPSTSALEFKNCKQVHKKYPNGVAFDPIVAALLTNEGYAYAKTNKKLYSKLTLGPKDLDKDNRLVACARKIKQTAPSVVRYAWGDYDFDDTITLRWSAPEIRGGADVTYLVRGVSADGLFFPESTRWFSREMDIRGADFQREYVFDVIAVNSLGESEPVRVVVNTGVQPQRPTVNDALPYYISCYMADRERVTPIIEIINPDLYDRNEHLDGDGDGIACEPTWRR